MADSEKASAHWSVLVMVTKIIVLMGFMYLMYGFYSNNYGFTKVLTMYTEFMSEITVLDSYFILVSFTVLFWWSYAIKSFYPQSIGLFFVSVFVSLLCSLYRLSLVFLSTNIFSWFSLLLMTLMFLYYLFMVYSYYFVAGAGVTESVPLSNMSKMTHLVLYTSAFQEVCEMLNSDCAFLKDDLLVMIEKYISWESLLVFSLGFFSILSVFLMAVFLRHCLCI